MSAQELSASRFVELCLDMVVSEISSYFTHTLYFLNTLLTTFLFTQPSHSTPSWTENDLHLLGFVPVYQHALSFAVRFSRWGIENFCIVFLYSLKETVKQGYFSGCLKCIKCYCPNKLWCRSLPLLLHCRCPKPQEPSSVTHRHHRLLTQKGIFSPGYYYEGGTNGNASNYHIQLVYSLLFTDQSVYCSVSNCSWNYKASGVCEQSFSLSVISYGKIMTSHCSQ
jgi:hypothetical protein